MTSPADFFSGLVIGLVLAFVIYMAAARDTKR